MNITVIRLVIVATSTGFVVMCKILTVYGSSHVILNARVNSTFLGRDSLLLLLIQHSLATVFIPKFPG